MKELFFELGLEELPARLVRGALNNLQSNLVQSLEAAKLSHGQVEVFATPRRLALRIDVSEGQEDVTTEMMGPPARIAFDDEGNATKAAVAFAQRNGISIDSLTTKATEKGDYLAATIFTPGKRSIELLPDMLVEAVKGLKWPKAMTWGEGVGPFIRPIHWMVALYDGDVLELEVMGIRSANATRGHRFMAPHEVVVSSCEQWLETLRDAYVEPVPDKRSERIATGAQQLAESVNGVLVMDSGLLEELTYLSEWPVPLLGTFDSDFLEVPSSALITSMRVHQKYAAITTANGKLTHYFVIVAGLPSSNPKTVVAGNERVLAARLADARFFFETDTQTTLESMIEALGSRIYLKGLGTMADKARRLSACSGELAAVLGASPEDITLATEAGLFAKADLSSQMVGEFASLQGQMGKRYAELKGRDARVSAAIEEHYWPKHATDQLPTARISVAVALADRLDALVGCFALGLEPTGSADPYALRRGALGVIRILAMSHDYPTCGLGQALDIAAAAYGQALPGDWQETKARLLAFIRGRLKHLYAKTHPTDLTEAVLDSDFDHPRDVEGRLEALAALKSHDDWEDLAIAVKRVVRIAEDQEECSLEPASLHEPAEAALYESFITSKRSVDEAIGEERYSDALAALIGMKPHIDRFFEDVMVMSEDTGERNRRMALLGEVANLFDSIASFEKVST